MFNRVKLMMAVALGRMLGSAPLSLHKAAMDHNRTVDAVRAAAAAASVAPVLRRPRGIASLLQGYAARIVGTRQIDRSKMHWGPNGIQECARRVRQIARGQLTVSNGLVLPMKRA